MTTLQAPFIDPKALPGTPAHEWASKTANELGSDPNLSTSSPDQTSAYYASTTSTPGPDFPGAYPRKGDPAADAKLGLGIIDTAKQDVQNVMSSAGETAKQYLPEVVTSYFVTKPEETSAPKSEDKQEISGSETSTPAITTTTNTVNPADTDNSSLSADNFSTQAQDGSATSKSSSLHAPTLTPDTHPASTTGGVGDLPGSRSETSVAVLPDEGNNVKGDNEQHPLHEPVLNITPRTHPLGGYGAKWRGVPLSEDHQQALDADPDRQLNIGNQAHRSSSPSQASADDKREITKADMNRVKERVVGAVPGRTTSPTALTFNATTTSGTADSTHSPQGILHDRDLSDAPSNTSSSMAAATPHSSKLQETSSSFTSTPRSRRASEGNGHGHGHKTKIMDKIRGEAKVISGKLAKNEEKVEEGRRLMGKV